MNAWIFHEKPSCYDVAKELKPEKIEEWTANRGHESMLPDDIVFFWRAAEKEPKKRGLYGWDGVIGAAKMSPAGL